MALISFRIIGGVLTALFVSRFAIATINKFELALTPIVPEILRDPFHTDKAVDCAHECSRMSRDECTGLRFDSTISKCTLFTGPVDISLQKFSNSVQNGSMSVYRRVNNTCSDHINFQTMKSDDDNSTYCLGFFPEKMSWDKAKELCDSRGARLPHAASISKMRTLADYVLSVYPAYLGFWVGAMTKGCSSNGWFHTLTGQSIPDNSSLWSTRMYYSEFPLAAFVDRRKKLGSYGLTYVPGWRSVLCEMDGY